MTTRRSFIKQSALITAALAVSPSELFAKKANIGIQLYTLKDIIGKDVKPVIAGITKTGYKQIETFGYWDGKFFGLTTAEFAKVIKDNGLTSPSGHYGLSGYLFENKEDDLKKIVDVASTLGHEYIVVPWIEEKYRTETHYKKMAEMLNKAGQYCKSYNIKMGYHNHQFEFDKIGNTTGEDILLSETDSSLVDFEMDLFWVVYAGQKPLEWFEKYKHRFTMWHVKDMNNHKDKKNTEIGSGVIDFKSIFANKASSGMKYFYVEQENFDGPKQMKSIAKSFKYIKRKLL